MSCRKIGFLNGNSMSTITGVGLEYLDSNGCPIVGTAAETFLQIFFFYD